MESNAFLGGFSVGKKIGLIVLIFAVGMILARVMYVGTELQNEKISSALNMVGRQRALNQFYARDLLLEKQGKKNDAPYWRQMFDETLDALISGGTPIRFVKTEERAEIPEAPTPEIRNSLLEQKRAFADLTVMANAYLAQNRDSPDLARMEDELLAKVDILHATINEAIELYVDHARNRSQGAIRDSIILGAVVLVIGLLLSFIIATRITEPLGKVVFSMQQIAEGNLKQEKLPVRSSDEIGLLATAFNSMLTALRGQIQQTNQATENLTSSAAEILAATQEQAATTKEQAASIQETSTTMEEVRKAGEQIADKAKEVGAAGEKTVTAGLSGLKVVQDSTRTMDAIREQVESVSENVVRLSEKTQAIGEIISGVNDIAEQSHLLALNASIEATAAGETGLRFGVVASEMKNLADQAKEATVQVRSILQEIQKGITSSVMLTEEAVKRVESGKKQAEETEQTIRQFSDTTTESVHTFQQIIAATNQQQIGYDQTGQALSDIKKAAEQTAAGTGQLEKAVANLNSLGQQLKKTVERYRI